MTGIFLRLKRLYLKLFNKRNTRKIRAFFFILIFIFTLFWGFNWYVSAQEVTLLQTGTVDVVNSSTRNGVVFEIVLGRPTNSSVTANIIADTDIELYVEYGIASGSYPLQTITEDVIAGDPIEFVLGGLPANTRCFYHIVYRTTGVTEWSYGDEYSFMTQRPPGESFTFTIASDSHFGQYGGQTDDEKALYAVTIANIAADQPDFHLDLGDTFAMDPSPLGTGMTELEADAAYYIQRPYLAPLTHSTP
ncbi:MAG: hypothetical protein ACK2U1_16140, partial [Anaerolineales bacterium]